MPLSVLLSHKFLASAAASVLLSRVDGVYERNSSEPGTGLSLFITASNRILHRIIDTAMGDCCLLLGRIEKKRGWERHKTIRDNAAEGKVFYIACLFVCVPLGTS